jgi:hypothetical protein
MYFLMWFRMRMTPCTGPNLFDYNEFPGFI